MLTFAQAAEQLIEDEIVPNMTPEGLRKLARSEPDWPISPDDYGTVAGARTLPYELLAPYIRERVGKRRGRGPDQQPRQPRSAE